MRVGYSVFRYTLSAEMNCPKTTKTGLRAFRAKVFDTAVQSSSSHPVEF